MARRVAQVSVTSDPAAMAQIVATVRRALVYVVAAVLFAGVILYPIQLSSSAKTIDQEWQAAASWLIYSASIGLNLFGQGYLFILNGIGHVGWDKVLRTFSSIASILAMWAALANGSGIVTLAAIQLVISIGFLVASKARLKAKLPMEFTDVRPDANSLLNLFSAGSKLLVLNLLGFAVTNFGLLVTEKRFGLAALLPLAAMLKIGTLLTTLSTLGATMSYPYIAKADTQSDKGACRRYYVFGVVGSLATYAVLAVPIYMFGRTLFEIWLGPGQYLGDFTFALVLVFHAILANHAAHSMPVLAVAGNAFMVPAVINGLLVVVLTLFLPKHLGIDSIPIAMILGTIGPSAFVVHVAVRRFYKPT